jgi:catechol 2,3-dioxygenase-like lactoylglutathione lyase family enzyme
MNSEGQLISFESSALSSNVGLRSKENGQGRVTGLSDQRVEIAMTRTPDGHSRLELSRFLTPPVFADHRNASVNALGYLRVMFAVDDIDETLGRLRKRGAQLVGDVVRYQDSYRLCYIRGPEGLLIGLAQELN